MEQHAIRAILEAVARGDSSADGALSKLRGLTAVDVAGHTVLDLDRLSRTGLPEAVYGASKSTDACVEIARRLDAAGHPVLVTRIDADTGRALEAALPAGRYHARPRLFVKHGTIALPKGRGPIAVVCAGTSDAPVADEAQLTLEAFGQRVLRIDDVGVAGLHRILARVPDLRRATVVIVVAGMEGALPGVVGGLVAAPVIAVPAPVGYGVSEGGHAALHTMLAACVPNITVVNIGNGFGAACSATLMNRADVRE